MTSKEIYQLHDKILADMGLIVSLIPTSNRERYESMLRQYFIANAAMSNMTRYADAQQDGR